MLIVSHDRHFVRSLVEGAPILESTGTSDNSDDGLGDQNDDDKADGVGVQEPGLVYQIGPKGKLTLLARGIDEYAKRMEKKMRKLALG